MTIAPEIPRVSSTGPSSPTARTPFEPRHTPTLSGSRLAALDPAVPSRRLLPDPDPTDPAAGINTVTTLPSGQRVCLAVRSGEAVGLVGPAGSGKTWLAQVVAGLLGDCRQDRPARRVALVADDATVHENLTVGATVAYWAAVSTARLPIPGTDPDQLVADVTAAVGLGRWLATPLAECHQVVRCALAVAVALLDRPTVLVLDEPLRKVAVRHRPVVLGLLTALHEHGIGLLYATRREADAALICGRTVDLPVPSAEVAGCRAG